MALPVVTGGVSGTGVAIALNVSGVHGSRNSQKTYSQPVSKTGLNQASGCERDGGAIKYTVVTYQVATDLAR